MASTWSNYLKDKVLDHLFGRTTFTAPATLYYAAMTTMPTDAGTGGVEATGGVYARVAFTNNTSNFSASASQVKVNAVSIDFGTQTTALGTIVGIAIYDASPGGNYLGGGVLATPIVISSGDPLSIPAGGAVADFA